MAVFKEPWGWSKLDVYRTCPYQFKKKFIDKVKEVMGPALINGQKKHEALEGYIGGWSNTLPEMAAVWPKRVDVLRNIEAVRTEAAWGIDKKWKILENWFQPETWCRAKSDVYYPSEDGKTMHLIDFKTGKYRVPSDDQIYLYATIGLSVMPKVEKVVASFWFIEQGVEPVDVIIPRTKLVKMRKYFEAEVKPMYTDKRFNPTPGQHCRFCQHSKQRGGDCKY